MALSEEATARFRRKRITREGLQLITLASTRFNIAVARASQNSMVVQMMELLLRRMEPVRMRALAELEDVTLSTRTLAECLAAIESGESAAGTLRVQVQPQVSQGVHPVACSVLAALRRELQVVWVG